MNTDTLTGIFSISTEMQIEIKKFLDDESSGRYGEYISLSDEPLPSEQIEICGLKGLKSEDVREAHFYRCGHVACVKYLCEELKVDFRKFRRIGSRYNVYKDKDKIVGKICKRGHVKILKYLIENQELNKEKYFQKETEIKYSRCLPSFDYFLLYNSCKGGHLDMVKFVMSSEVLNKSFNIDITYYNFFFVEVIKHGHWKLFYFFLNEVGIKREIIIYHAIPELYKTGNIKELDYILNLYKISKKYFFACQLQNKLFFNVIEKNQIEVFIYILEKFEIYREDLIGSVSDIFMCVTMTNDMNFFKYVFERFNIDRIDLIEYIEVFPTNLFDFHIHGTPNLIKVILHKGYIDILRFIDEKIKLTPYDVGSEYVLKSLMERKKDSKCNENETKYIAIKILGTEYGIPVFQSQEKTELFRFSKDFSDECIDEMIKIIHDIHNR